MTERFSDRHGYHADERDITIREDAPEDLRFAIPLIAQDAGEIAGDRTGSGFDEGPVVPRLEGSLVDALMHGRYSLHHANDHLP